MMIKVFVIFIFSGTAFAGETTVNNMGRIVDKNSNLSDKSIVGSVYAAKDTFGMRANAVVAGFRANAILPLDYPIVGFESLLQMGRYKDRDSVALYADNTSPPLKTWEVVSAAYYTATSFTANDADYSQVKPGMLIDTDHHPKWSSYVVSIKGKKVITSGWVNSQTHHLGIPESGIGLTINPLTKIWATNFNLFFIPGGKAKNGVIQENGIVNNSVSDPNAINGIDTVVLPQSRFGGTASYLSRAADGGGKQQWVYGFISQGAKNSFVSSDSAIHAPLIGFQEMSSALYGLVFEGKNKLGSVIWRNNGKITASIEPDGEISRLSLRTSFVNNNTRLATDFSRYVFQNERLIEVTLPEAKSLNPGFTLKLVKTNHADIIIKTTDGVEINGEEMIHVKGQWSKDIFYQNNNWYIY